MPTKKQRVRVRIRVGRDPRASEPPPTPTPSTPTPSVIQYITEHPWLLLGGIIAVIVFLAMANRNDSSGVSRTEPQQAAQVVAPTNTPTSSEPTNTPEPTSTPTLTPTSTETPTPSSSPTASDTPFPTETSTETSTPTFTPTPTNTPTPTFTPTSTLTPTPTSTPTPTHTPTPVFAWEDVSDWSVRVYNVDEQASFYVNDQLIDTFEKQRDSGWIDITDRITPHLDNFLRFSVWNEVNEYTWGFAIKADDQIIWENVQGEVGLRGADNYNLSKQGQTVFDKTVKIASSGQVIMLPDSPYQWFVRLSDADEIGTIFLNGRKVIEVSYRDGGDTGWIEITDKVPYGRESSIRFTIYNSHATAGWTASVRKDNKTVWSESDSNRSIRLAYDKFIYITADGEVSAVPEQMRWHVRVRLADEHSLVSINGEPTIEMYLRDAEQGWVDITHLIQPASENILRFSHWNGHAIGAWDFALMRNNSIVWEQVTEKTETGQVFDYLLFIQPDGEIAGDSPTDNWFVRVYDNDDSGAVYVNGKLIYEEDAQIGDWSDWIDITGEMTLPQDNTIRFTNYNKSGPGKWRFQVRRNNSIIWEEAGEIAAEGNTHKIVYDETLTVTESGELVVP